MRCSDSLLSSHWRWLPFLLFHFAAALLLLSWLWPPTRMWWDALDQEAFRALNAPMAEAPGWASFWALANVRLTDAVAAVIMLAFLVGRNWIFPGDRVRRALFTFIVLLGLLVVFRAGFTLAVNTLGWQRDSPSLVLENAVRLSRLFPDGPWHIKDASGYSFPGDHAAVLLLWVLFLSLFARGLRLVLIWTVCLMFAMPRLVAGAHWLSDDLVGGLFLVWVTLAWGGCTPFAFYVVGRLEKITAPAFGFLKRLPGLGRLALIREE